MYDNMSINVGNSLMNVVKFGELFKMTTPSQARVPILQENNMLNTKMIICSIELY